ncbi:hypothetical protein RJ639_019940 [Escallonia herrerae]|uniref:Transposase (putative) gypsy type domain-containing protein n=1 Tax=Escallonia herrerae TaxID=1293975 RepID=A0AA88V8L1_9ASTE|nr:hypothetical protein RJ639_019940 [Escallonia herrerae]
MGFCLAVITLLGQSVRMGLCSDRILLGPCHSASVECSDGILFGQNSARPLSLCSGRVFGRDSVRTKFCSAVVTLLEQSVRTGFCLAVITLHRQSVWMGFCSDRILLGRCRSAPAECSDTILFRLNSARLLSLCSGSVFRRDSTRAEFCSATVTLFGQSVRMGFCSNTILAPFTCWYARLPGLQEPANYDTKFETGVYEEQVKSGYRLPLHHFALFFFEHYRMAPRQLVPNGWRKLAGLIYLVQTSGYKPDATDFMRVFFKICFVKRVANCLRWYYIHSRQRLLKGGPKSNKGWHSRYFFIGCLDKGELPFDRDWNPFCKDFENPGKPTPNNLHILSHIKLQGGLCIDEPLLEEQLEWAKIIPPKPIPAGLLIPYPPPAITSVTSVETVPLESQGEVKRKAAKCGVAPAPKRTRVTPPERSPRILEQVSEQHLLHGILPRDKEVFQTQTHESFACSFAQAVYTMYASGSEMLSRFKMARQVTADEAQQNASPNCRMPNLPSPFPQPHSLQFPPPSPHPSPHPLKSP